MSNTLKLAREKSRKHNALVRKLENDGFVCCSGYVFTGDSFDNDTCTWSPNSKRIGELVWDGSDWSVKYY